jgi:hypothetical protein
LPLSDHLRLSAFWIAGALLTLLNLRFSIAVSKNNRDMRELARSLR